MKNQTKKSIIYFSFMFAILSMFLFSIGNSVEFRHDQANIITDYRTSVLGASYEYLVVGNLNNVNIGSKIGDEKIEIRGVDNPIYLLIDNNYYNNTFNITYINDDPIDIYSNTSNIAITQELNMQEKGTYYFKFTPSHSGENFDFIINIDDSKIINTYTREEQQKGFNSLMGGMVDSFLQIVTINIQLWKIAFYMTITLITIGLIVGLFTMGFYLLNKAKKLRESKFSSYYANLKHDKKDK